MNGIYLIECMPNNKVYVGSSTRILTRLSRHRSDLRAGRHHCSYLQRAWNRYGEQAFEFVVLDTFEFTSVGDLIEREVYYWMLCQPNTLNKTRPAVWTPKTMEQRAQVVEQNRGRKPSAETRARMSESHKKLDRPWLRTEPIKLCIAKTRSSHFFILPEVGAVFDSLYELASFLNLTRKQTKRRLQKTPYLLNLLVLRINRGSGLISQLHK